MLLNMEAFTLYHTIFVNPRLMCCQTPFVSKSFMTSLILAFESLVLLTMVYHMSSFYMLCEVSFSIITSITISAFYRKVSFVVWKVPGNFWLLYKYFITLWTLKAICPKQTRNFFLDFIHRFFYTSPLPFNIIFLMYLSILDLLAITHFKWGRKAYNINNSIYVFTKLAPRGIQSISCNVRLCACRVFVPSNVDRNQESWRLVVEEHIFKIAKLKT